MAFDEKKFVGTDALSELSTKVKTELDKKTDKAGALTNVSYDTTNKKFTKTTQGAHDPVTTDIVTTSTLKNDMGIADFDGTFNSLKSKPTTISGYGITDAKVQNSTVTIGSSSVTALTQEDVSSTYDSSGTSPVDGKAIAAALGTLDVESVGGAGKYISAISETDGKISATAETMDSTPTSSSTKAVTSDGIYEYVNSSVATNTAYFIGTFDSVEELEAYSGIITNNDYAFVTSTDSSGNTLYNRYKYNGSTHTWSFEYALNNSSFTSAQWATIQSGLTSSDKTKLDGIQSGANKTIVDAAMSSSSTNPVQNKVVNTALAGKQDTLTFDSTPTQSSTNPVTSAGIYTDQARQDALEAQDRAALIEVENKGSKNLSAVNSVTDQQNYIDIDVNLKAGKYIIFAGSISTTSSDTSIRIGVYKRPTNLLYTYIDVGSNKYSEFEISGDADTVRIFATNSSSISSGEFLTFSDFMLCTKSEWDISQAYAPYGKTNADLTAEADYAVNTGVKNLLKIDKSQIKSSSWNTDWTWSGDTASNGNASITINQDDTFTVVVSNTMAAQVIFDIYLSNDDVSNVILSGCPSGGSSSTHFMYVKGTSYYDTGNGVTFSKTGPFRIAIVVASEHAAGTYIFKPMIRSAAISDTSYQPYARSNPVLTAEMDYVVNAGAKNILEIGIQNANPSNVEFTDNGDGTITVNGTASAAIYNRIFTIPDKYIGKRLKITGCSGGNYTNTYAIYVVQGGTSTTIAKVETAGQIDEFTVPNSGCSVRILVRSGTQMNNVVFSPMLWDAEITDPTFQPYAKTNRELTVLTDEDRAGLVELVDSGAKNICNWIAGTSTISGVTFTINNDDRTVSTSGSATARSQKALQFTVPSTLKAGRYVLSGCPNGGEQSGTILYCLYIWDLTANVRVSSNDTGNGREFDWTPDASHIYNITIDVRSGSSAEGLTFNPMICTLTARKISQTYQPYRPSYKELSDNVNSLENGSFVGIELQSGDDLNNLSRGRYYCRTATISAQILNNPNTGSGFVLDYMYNAGNAVQMLYPSSSSSTVIYKRSYASSSWRPWCKFEGTEVT